MTVYVLIITEGPTGPEPGLAALRDGSEASIAAHVAAVLAYRSAQWRPPLIAPGQWATVAVCRDLSGGDLNMWHEEVRG